MEENEHAKDISLYISLIQQNFPEVELRSVRPITRGWDSFVLDVNGELIFRFPMRDDVMVYLRREIRLLPLLEPALTTPIPHFRYLGQGNADYPHTFVGYTKLDGVALESEEITGEQLARLAPALARFLSELHRFPTGPAIQAGVEAHTPEQWRERYRARYLDLQKRVFPRLDEELRARSAQLWEGFLEDRTVFAFQPALIHCDLNGEHILCDPERGVLTGVIDWGDVTIGDPALDFVGLHWQHGRAFVEQVLRGYQGQIDGAFWKRMDFYLCYEPFAQLIYGAYEENEKFIQQGVAGLRALFGI
jgi:aminoglycoside 2''-phosphotransferase